MLPTRGKAVELGNGHFTTDNINFRGRPVAKWIALYGEAARPEMDEIRAELHRILQSSGMWDGKVWNLQVAETSERTMHLRALMSAPDASSAWDLRCHVREQLLGYLQREYPQFLPRDRADVAAALERKSQGGPKS